MCLVELVIPKRTNKFPWQLFTERVPFSDVLASAIPLEIAIRGLEPEWPGSDAEARGLTSGVWKMMKECWKREPSSRTILGSDLWETSPISLTGLRVILGDARTFCENFPHRQLLSGSVVVKESSKASKSAGCLSNVWNIKLQRRDTAVGDTFGRIGDKTDCADFSARIVNTSGRLGDNFGV